MTNRIKSLKKTSFTDKDLTKLQTNVEVAIKPIAESVIIDGILLKNILLDSSNTNIINHKLSRKPLGWTIIRKRANSDIWDSQDNNKNSEKTLLLECSANVTVDLWVF